MSEYNIMITSIGNPKDRDVHGYYYRKENGMMWYCDSMSVAEAGTKYILSKVPINEIIVLGKGNSFEPGEEMDPIELQGWTNFSTDSIDEMSEYRFFLYRLSQYIEGLDIDGIDVLDSIEPERKKELLSSYQTFRDQISREIDNYRPDRVFHYLASDKSVYRKMRDSFPPMTRAEKLWLKRHMYSIELNDGFKLKSLVENEKVRISLIPGADDSEEYIPGKNVHQIVKALYESEADTINVYMDMQGLEQSDGYLTLAVLSMLSNDTNSPIVIKEIITSHDFDRFANPIDNDEMRRYQINNLISGMHSFIRYGKVDELQAYWHSKNIQNKHIDLLLYAMKRVDEGISFCNTADLEFGIRLLKMVFQSTEISDMEETESNIFRIIEGSIRNDYGALLEGDYPDELELVRWAVRKKLYQQALTIVESRFPDAFVYRGIFYYANDEESKNQYIEAVNKCYWEEQPKDRWKYNDMPHYFIKYYGKNEFNKSFRNSKITFTDLRLMSLDGGEDCPLVQAFSVLNEKRELLKTLFNAYADLSFSRNELNHAATGTMPDIEDIDIEEENQNVAKVTETLNSFISTYAKVRQYIAENVPADFKPVIITPEEFKDYTFNHKIETDGYKKKYYHHDDSRRNDEKKDESAPQTQNGENKPAEQNAPQDRPRQSGESIKTDTFGTSRDGNVVVTRVRKTTDGKPSYKITITIDEGSEGQK